MLEPPKHRVLLALVLDLRQREVLLQLILDRRSSLLLVLVVVLGVGKKKDAAETLRRLRCCSPAGLEAAMPL